MRNGINGLSGLVNSVQKRRGKKEDVYIFINRQLFGIKRERFISNETVNQLSLPFDVPEAQEETQIIEQEIEYTRKKKEEGRASRQGQLFLRTYR